MVYCHYGEEFRLVGIYLQKNVENHWVLVLIFSPFRKVLVYIHAFTYPIPYAPICQVKHEDKDEVSAKTYSLFRSCFRAAQWFKGLIRIVLAVFPMVCYFTNSEFRQSGSKLSHAGENVPGVRLFFLLKMLQTVNLTEVCLFRWSIYCC